jgi:hypothetical protein
VAATPVYSEPAAAPTKLRPCARGMASSAIARISSGASGADTSGRFGALRKAWRRRARSRRGMSQLGQTEKNSVRAYVFRFALELGHRVLQSACLFRANALNRCAIARCAGSPTASAATGGKIVRGCAACLRTWWSRIERSAIPRPRCGRLHLHRQEFE